MDRSGKKTAAAIHQEITREVNLILSRIFAELRWGSQVDLEAVENAFRTGLHQAGASALTEVLQFAVPDAEHRQLLVPAEGSPSYVDMRSKTVLTMLGEARVVRPYYGLNPKIETIAIDTLCRERNCEWQRSEEWGITHWSSRRRRLSG